MIGEKFFHGLKLPIEFNGPADLNTCIPHTGSALLLDRANIDRVIHNGEERYLIITDTTFPANHPYFEGRFTVTCRDGILQPHEKPPLIVPNFALGEILQQASGLFLYILNQIIGEPYLGTAIKLGTRQLFGEQLRPVHAFAGEKIYTMLWLAREPIFSGGTKQRPNMVSAVVHAECCVTRKNGGEKILIPLIEAKSKSGGFLVRAWPENDFLGNPPSN